jgi:NAD(P)-dependent dehydrogenase (short-subunit alcohol dehydrogenase family)
MVEEDRLRGARILVTGGTTGIGRATVERLAAAGAKVIVVGRNTSALDECLSGLNRNDGMVFGISADVSAEDDIAKIFDMVDRQFGGLDILVACAAVGAEPIDEMAEAEWRFVVGTNLIGAMACARGAIARMERAGAGQLIFVGSVSSEIKAVGESVYAATKAGLQAFAETLRKELADRDIRVGVVQPGSVNTDLQTCSDAEKQKAIADGEMLHAPEIADAILFMLTRSDRADVVNLRIEPVRQKYR